MLLPRDAMCVPDDEDALTEAGRRQAKLFAEALYRLRPSLLVTSPIRRAREHAEILGNELRLTPLVDARLAERHMCQPPTLSLDESRKAQIQEQLNPRRSTYGGESVADHRARCSGFLKELTSQEVECVAVVAHGGTIEQTHSLLAGSPLEWAARAFVRCDPGCAHVWVRLRTERVIVWRLDLVNAREPELLRSFGVGYERPHDS